MMIKEFVFFALGIITGAAFFWLFLLLGRKTMRITASKNRFYFSSFFLFARYLLLGGITIFIMNYFFEHLAFFLGGILFGNILARLIWMNIEVKNGNPG